MMDYEFPPEMMKEREKQLIMALADCAGAYYDINLTQNRILGNPIQVVDGVQSSIHDQIGMPNDCAYTEMIQYWGQKVAPQEQTAFFAFFSPDAILQRYAQGERLLTHRYWTKNLEGKPMLAVHKMRLYEDSQTGDVLGLSYIADDMKYEKMQRKEAWLTRRYDEAISRAEALQKAGKNLPGGYHRCLPQEGYPFAFVSKSFEEVVGYTKEQLETELDNKFINLVIPEDLPRFARFEKTLEGNGNADVAYRIRRRDGQIRWVQDSTLYLDWEDQPCYQCTLADITDFVHQQEDVAKQRAEFEEMAATIPCGYHRCTTDNGFRLDFVSDSFLDAVGYSREEALGMSFLEMVAQEDRELFLSHEPQLVKEGRVDLAYRVCRKDGSYRWVKDSTMRMQQHGKEYYQCILADITDFVQRQEVMLKQNLELSQREALLETMERTMPGGYIRCRAEKDLPVSYVGSHFTDIVGYTWDEIKTEFGNLYKNLIWPEDADQIETYNRMLAKRDGGYDTSVYRIRHKDGGYRWVTDSTMYVEMGEDSFFQGIVSDITTYIDALDVAKKEAEASNLAKSTFLFNASHDIRTPMNAIQGYAHIIEETPDDPAVVKDAVHKIMQASRTLMTLLNDVLDLSRIERGKEDVEEQPMDMERHAVQLYEMFNEEMEQAGIRFQVENQLTHPHVLGDELKLTRIAMNLLSNAKKFTPAGGKVTFGIREDGYTGDQATYTLFVRDTGIGMSEEFQKRAFDQFERERTSTESGVSGSGLGLAIIKRFTDLMRGQCRIESKTGKGTEIQVAVPLRIAANQAANPAAELAKLDFTGKRVLLVEDNDFNREIARYMFESLGLTVEEAENGVICLDKLLSAPAGTYDFILMDIQMPIMDGYRATWEIRNHADPAIARIPIIAMTANAFEEDRKRCLEAGMNGHIGKPLEAEVVLKELKRVLAM